MELPMEIRAVTERIMVGVVAPYDEITYLSPDPNGERIMRGAFKRSIAHHAQRGIPLLRNHQLDRVMGRSVKFTETPEGLIGEFKINDGDDGDRLLEDISHGYLAGLSVGFQPLERTRGTDGVREVRQARLHEVSAIGVPAYEGAAMLAVRAARPVAWTMPPRPEVNLDPLPPILYRPR